METGPGLKVSSNRLEKQRIEPVTAGLQGNLSHFVYPLQGLENITRPLVFTSAS